MREREAWAAAESAPQKLAAEGRLLQAGAEAQPWEAGAAQRAEEPVWQMPGQGAGPVGSARVQRAWHQDRQSCA